jgi:hypothetical protein
VLDLISRHSLVLHDCRFVVLDEADEMLDLGFLEDVERILSLTPNSRQTALFSATMPPPIRKLADNYLYEPELVKVASAKLTVDTVEQFEVEVKQADKAEKLVEVLRAERPDQAIVFVRTKVRCDQLNRKLQDQGLNVKALHGDMSQGARDGVMLGFKGGRVPILVATDVAARGLDISTVTHVINFDVPISPDVYVHRIGRTGRVGRSGRAVTFVEPRQQRELEAIEEHIKTKLTPWAPGATTDAAPVEEKPRRHEKPHVSRNGDEPYQRSWRGSAPRPASRWPTSSTRSPRPRAWTGRPCATSSSSSASRSCPCRAPRPPGGPRGRRRPGRIRATLAGARAFIGAMAASHAPRPCRSCGAALAPEQDWCLECGTARPGRLGRAPGWKPVAAVAGLTLALVGGASVAAYAGLEQEAGLSASAPVGADASPVAGGLPAIPPSVTPGPVEPVEPVDPPATTDSTPATGTPVDPGTPSTGLGTGAGTDFGTGSGTTGTGTGSTGTGTGTTSAGTGTDPGNGNGTGSGTGSGTTDDDTDTGQEAEPDAADDPDEDPNALVPLALDAGASKAYDPYARSTVASDPAQATDGKRSTAWTATVPGEGPMQLGLVVDLESTKAIRGIQLTTRTPASPSRSTARTAPSCRPT